MAASLGAAQGAATAITSLADMVLTIYDAIGERKLGRSDLIFHIQDWASLINFGREPIRKGLLYDETHARAVRMMDLNAALGAWLAANGFKITSAKPEWRRPLEFVKHVVFPSAYLAKRAQRFAARLDLINTEMDILTAALEKPDLHEYKPPAVAMTYALTSPLSVFGGENDGNPDRPATYSLQTLTDPTPDATAAISRLQSATKKLGK